MENLNTLFTFMKKQTYKGVKGYLCIDSKNPGPVLGITALTHGNEYAGLAAIQYVLDNKENLKAGKVILGINNIDAAEQNKRCINVNMNRLPEDLENINADNEPEIARAKEILPATREFDISLDIHSTTEDSTPILLDISGGSEALYTIFDTEYVIQNIAEKQIGLPLCAFYGKDAKGVVTLGFEAGQHVKVQGPLSLEVETGIHTEDAALKNAVNATKRLLCALNIFETQTPIQTYQGIQTIYKVVDTVILSDDYTLAQPRTAFEYIKAGEALAQNKTQTITMPKDGYNFLGVSTAQKNEESFFLLEKVN